MRFQVCRAFVGASIRAATQLARKVSHIRLRLTKGLAETIMGLQGVSIG